mgnify:CR=1 FL=1
MHFYSRPVRATASSFLSIGKNLTKQEGMRFKNSRLSRLERLSKKMIGFLGDNSLKLIAGSCMNLRAWATKLIFAGKA